MEGGVGGLREERVEGRLVGWGGGGGKQEEEERGEERVGEGGGIRAHLPRRVVTRQPSH